MREVFDLFDEDGDGIISRGEVALVIQSMLGTTNSSLADFYFIFIPFLFSILCVAHIYLSNPSLFRNKCVDETLSRSDLKEMVDMVAREKERGATWVRSSADISFGSLYSNFYY